MTSSSTSSHDDRGQRQRTPRRRARELALQGVYQWLVAGNAVQGIEAQLKEGSGYHKADSEYLHHLLTGAIAAQSALEDVLKPHLDRPVAELRPVERAILLLGAFELRQQIDIPYRIVIDEAVELAKSYGGTDGYKYVNAVLDKLARELRPVETGAAPSGMKSGGP